MASPLPAVPRLLTAVVVSSVAAFSALILGTYFLVNSSLGPSLIKRLGGGDTLTVSAVRWSPRLTSFALLDVRASNIHGATTLTAKAMWVSMDVAAGRPRELALLDATVFSDRGRPGIAAGRISATVDPTAQALGAFRIAKMRADNYLLNLRWRPDGTFNLSESFAFDDRTSSAPTPPRVGPDGKPLPPDMSMLPWLEIDNIVLAKGELYFQWPGGSLDARDVTARGGYGTRPWLGLLIDADLEAGTTTLTQQGIWQPQRWRSLTIDAYRMRGTRTTVQTLVARLSDQHHITLNSVDVSPSKVMAQADVRLPELVAGPVSGTEVAMTAALDLTPNPPLSPSGWIEVQRAAAASLKGPGWWLTSARVERLKATAEMFDATVAIPLADADEIGLRPGVGVVPGDTKSEDVVVKGPKLAGTAEISGTTATFAGRLDTAQDGGLSVDGKAHLSLLRQEVEFTFGVAARQLSGGLARLFADVSSSGPDRREGASPQTRYRTTGSLAAILQGTWQPKLERLDTPAASSTSTPDGSLGLDIFGRSAKPAQAAPRRDKGGGR